MKLRCLAAGMAAVVLVVPATSQSAATGTLTSQVEEIRSLAKEQIRAESLTCFMDVRTMLIGYASSQRGVPAQHYVETGAVQKDSHPHRLLLRGYKMTAADDADTMKYYEECMAKSK